MCLEARLGAVVTVISEEFCAAFCGLLLLGVGYFFRFRDLFCDYFKGYIETKAILNYQYKSISKLATIPESCR